MATTLQTPIRREPSQKVGRRIFRKQILPVGKLTYNGRTLDFSKEYLAELARNFRGGAYDQVPFQLANDKNEHTADPERTRGEVKGLEARADGLYGLIELSEKGAELVAENPRLGVSARIVEDHPKGKALAHVLGTLDPRATGMKAWEAVELANTTPGDTLIDLTGESYDGGDMPETKTNLSAEETATLRALLAKADGADTAVVTKPAEKTDDADLDAALAALLDGTEKVDPAESEPVVATLAAEHVQAIQLANSQASEARGEVETLRATIAKERAESEVADYIEAGVPPAIVDLARPVLEHPSAVVDLANGGTLDAQGVIRKILDEVKGTIDLSEIGGHLAHVGDDDQTTQAVGAWADQHGR